MRKDLEFEKLPKDIQTEVKDMLKAYDTCSVIYENGKMKVVTCGYVYNQYADDHKFIGKYHAVRLYTDEERKQNFKETFGYEKRF